MARVVRINMSSKEVREEESPEPLAGLGGRALTSRLVLREVPATCHPLGGANKLVFAPGVLTGTVAPSSGRTSVGAKSPLTGGIKESNAGGVPGQKLAKLGIQALVIEGAPSDHAWSVIEIDAGGVRIVSGKDYAGLGCYELNQRLAEKYGNVGIIAIGPAGEMRLSGAGISMNDMENGPGRYAGRGGLGAVMGSKGVKAIVVDDADAPGVTYADEAAFRAAATRFAKDVLLKHPVTSEALPTYGTAVLINIINEAGGLPTRNFRRGRFEGAEKVSGEMIAEMVKKRGGKGKTGHPCHPGCVIRCSNVYPDENGDEIVACLEYESDWALGPNCGIDDLDAVARLVRACNDLGLDTIEAGVTIGVAMEAGVVEFGDASGAIGLLEEVRNRTPLGHLIGSGAAVFGKAYGVRRVPVVKGQGLPAYDPRSIKGIGVTYATSPMGADHTAGYTIAPNILKSGGYVDPLKPDGQVECSRNLQVATAGLDSAGLCIFTAFAILDIDEGMSLVCEMMHHRLGAPFTADDFTALGKQVLHDELAFNKKAGFTRADDRLPEFFRTEFLPPHNVVFDVPNEQLDLVHEV